MVATKANPDNNYETRAKHSGQAQQGDMFEGHVQVYDPKAYFFLHHGGHDPLFSGSLTTNSLLNERSCA